jgi:hypothetical protein
MGSSFEGVFDGKLVSGFGDEKRKKSLQTFNEEN